MSAKNPLTAKFGAALLALVGATAAQAGPTYFLAGSPGLESQASYSVQLYRLDDDGHGLRLVRSLTTQRQGAVFVRSYDDLGLAIVGSEGAPHRAQFDLVRYADPERPLQLEVAKGQRDLFPDRVFLLRARGGDPVLAVQRTTGAYGSASQPLTAHLEGLALDGSEAKLDMTALAEVHSSGDAGVIAEGGYPPDIGPNYAEVGGRFLLGYAGGEANAGFAGPDLSAYAQKNAVTAVLANDEIRVFHSYEMWKKNGDDSIGVYAVQDRARGTYSRVEVPGDRTSVRAFARRLAFVVAYAATDSAHGGRKPSAQESEYFASPAHRLTGIAPTGRVVLVDTADGARAEFDTGSADVDVLAIDDAGVLYRAGPAFFRRSWQGTQVGAEQALFTDRAVGPAVHWAFRAGKK